MSDTSLGGSSAAPAAHRTSTGILTWLLMVLVLALYSPVLAGMASVWWHDRNASHGPLIPIIAGFLAWPKLGRVRALARRSGWGLVALTGGLLLYPAGLFAGVEFVPEVSLMVVLGALMLYFLGPASSRELAFPYAFLYFMVPWPDTLVEFVSFPMQLFSARFAAMVMGLAGIPVGRDGVDIHLSRYTFSVGVPCSGMRSLVALLALSALVAYLLHGPRWKRWALFVAGIPLAMLANVGRIVCILLIATIWNAEVAEGFFHGFSGVVVFLFATLGLLATGRALGLRQQPMSGASPGALPGGAGPPPGKPLPLGLVVTGRPLGPRAIAAPLVLVLTAGAVVLALKGAQGSVRLVPADFSQVPMQVGEWEGEDLGPLDSVSQEVLHPDAYMARLYVRPDRYPVDVAVVFGHKKETFHSPGFCLLGGGWNITRKSRRPIVLGSGARRILANQFGLQREDHRRVVLYWYASHRETTPSWVLLQYRLLRNRVLGRPSGGALVRVTAPVASSEESAARVAEDLIRELYDDLEKAMAL